MEEGYVEQQYPLNTLDKNIVTEKGKALLKKKEDKGSRRSTHISLKHCSCKKGEPVKNPGSPFLSINRLIIRISDISSNLATYLFQIFINIPDDILLRRTLRIERNDSAFLVKEQESRNGINVIILTEL